ncbi:MAG TPA: DUF1269 domain-containing protein [Candidatus Methylomirabilis sp.]|nr:DUF1269 domain-containing protein [Candidatus Methylomirabilis sp.]
MTGCSHLWAVGFDSMERAAQVREEITRLARELHGLNLLEAAVAVRYSDGMLTLDGEPFPVAVKIHGGTVARLLADLALGAPPMTSAAVGAMFATLGATTVEVGISDKFVREIEGLIQPGTSVLFVLDEVGDIDAILRGIRGLGGTVLKTNVDLERAKLIQSTLAAAADSSRGAKS